MGMFQVDVRVANPRDPEKFFEEKFWVDTGAFYTYIPEERLHAIGLQPMRTRALILADGRQDRRLQSEAFLTIGQLSESATCPVIFAPTGSLYLLGATALEMFGVQADPASQTLKPITAIIAAVA